jgi:uncharacterized RDD family membrane protein YckC
MQMANTQDIRYAGFWLRVWAAAVDLLFFLLVTVPLLYAIHGRDYFRCDVSDRGPVDFLNMFVLPNIMVPLCWLLCSATPGKMAISARIVDAKTGMKPRPIQFIIRFLGCYLSYLTFGLGILWIAFDRRKQGLHDKLAGTVVVHTK